MLVALLATLTAAVSIPTIPFEKYTLDNGLEVILHEDHRLPIVAVNVVYHVGAVDEPRDRTGFAHLFEHLMFQGSKHVDEHIAIVEDAGALTFNGFTDFDYTEYIETLPASELELGLWLESDRMGFLLDALDQAKFDNQREVVKNERRQSFDDAPYGNVEEAVLKAAYPKTHPYADGVIGSMAHLDSATVTDAKQFFSRHYAPANATLTIAGDLDVAKTKQHIARYFGTLPKREKPKRTKPAMPEKPVTPRVVLDEALGVLPQIAVAFVTPAALEPGDAEMDVWAQVLAGGKASRLHQALVIEAGVAESVSAEVQNLQGGSLFQITAVALDAKDAAGFEAAVDEALTAALKDPVRQDELQRIAAKWQTGTLVELEAVGGEHGKANALQFYNHYAGDPGAFSKDIERHLAITPDAMTKAAQRWLGRDRRVTVVSIPKPSAEAKEPPKSSPVAQKTKAQRDPNDPEAFRWERPQKSEAKALALGKIETATLDNGLTVLVHESHAVPLVAIHAVTAVGAAADPKNAPGVVAALVDWLDEGAGDRDAKALDEAFATLGTELSESTSEDGSALRTIVLKEHAAKATALVADVLLRPALKDAELEGVIERHVAAVLDADAQPFSLAFDRLRERLFGAAHPYGHSPQGTAKALQAMKPEALRRFYKERFGPKASALVFSGDLTLAEATAIAKASFGEWKGASAKPAPFTTSDQKRAGVLMYEKPNIGQTTLALGALAVPFAHADAAALRLLSDIFGGLFHSRLNMRLREELGITYGAYAEAQRMRSSGAVFVGTQVRADATGQAVKETLALLDGLRTKPVTDAELQAAKNAIVKALPGLFEHASNVAALGEQLYVADLPLDWMNEAERRIERVTAKDLQRVAKQYLRSDRLHIAVVGDKQVVSKQVGPLGIGKIVVAPMPR
ncbi:MAG: insulinase family protein [Deltaproteobacteria bacterium]|nr:insulinase family protein [Deltaproteobacteria bacterium]